MVRVIHITPSMERDLKISESLRAGLWNAAPPIQSNRLGKTPRRDCEY